MVLAKIGFKAPLIATAPIQAKSFQPARKPSGVIGLAPTRPSAPLEQKHVEVALAGIAASLRAAAKRGAGPLQSAIRQATSQLDRLDLTATGSGPGITRALSQEHLAIVANASPEERKVLGEVLAANPHPPSTVLDLLSISPIRDASLAKLAKMFPGADAMGGMPALKKALAADLAEGDLGTQLTAHMTARGMKGPEIEAFMNVLAETRAAFAAGAPGDDMQRTNWIHTRVELLHTLEAASRLKLDPMETKASLYGALFSDSFKDAGPYSVAWHNRPGAELAAPLVMSRHLDMKDPENRRLLDWSMRVAHEHQITPPLFMSGALGAVMGQHVAKKTPDEQKALQPAIEEIKLKTFKPLEAPQTNGEIEFSPQAQALLREIGVPGWAVTHDAPWARASQAAILGDVWQYASPDGLIKYGHDLRDPRHAVPMFRDPLLSAAVESSLGFSLGQGASVIADADLRALLDDEQKKMRALLDSRVYPEVDRLLRKEMKLGPDAAIPYWNTPVSAEISPAESATIDRVKKTFETVMASVGGVPLDPFASRKP